MSLPARAAYSHSASESSRYGFSLLPVAMTLPRPPKGARTETVERSVIQVDQVRPRRPGLERIAEVLRLAGNLTVDEFHDAHDVRWHAVIAEHEFGDPEIAVADDPLDGEPDCG